MDNLITGLIGVTIFLAFAIGLAVSIKSLPFALIVGAVSLMVLIDFFQSAKEGFSNKKVNKS